MRGELLRAPRGRWIGVGLMGAAATLFIPVITNNEGWGILLVPALAAVLLGMVFFFGSFPSRRV
jgi:hypothetical protein